jgi:hypothetical protein
VVQPGTDLKTAAPGGARTARTATYALVLWLTVLVTVWGAVLTMLRAGGVAVPVGLVLVLALGPLCWWGGSIAGSRWGAAGPAALWALLVLPMLTQRREGDLIITGGLRGVCFLALGALAAAGAVGSWPATATPAGRASRDTSHGGVVAR